MSALGMLRLRGRLQSISYSQHHSVCPRTLHTSSTLNVYNSELSSKETPTSGVAISSRVKMLNFPPFIKDLYKGVFNKSILSYAEVLNYDRHYNLDQKVQDIEAYIVSKKESLSKVLHHRSYTQERTQKY